MELNGGDNVINIGQGDNDSNSEESQDSDSDNDSDEVDMVHNLNGGGQI